MNPRIGLVHALYESIAPLQQACDAHWPQAEVLHLFDGSLYADYRDHGELTLEMDQRITRLLQHSAASGVRGILFSGSLFGASVERVRSDFEIPILTAYEAMIEAAFQQGTRLGLLATVAESLHLLQADVERYAERSGISCTLETRHVSGALETLQSGNATAHHQAIADSAAELVDCDALLLAQHSMAPARSRIASVAGRQILTSPDTAIGKLQHLVRAWPANKTTRDTDARATGKPATKSPPETEEP